MVRWITNVQTREILVSWCNRNHRPSVWIGSYQNKLTSTHSSRIRTARLLTVSEGEGEGFCPTPGGLHPGGSAQPQGVCIWGVCPNLGGVCPTLGVLHPGVCPTPGGLHRGGSASRGDVGKTPSPSPPVNRMTHRCKNITLPQTSFAGGN